MDIELTIEGIEVTKQLENFIRKNLIKSIETYAEDQGKEVYVDMEVH